MNNQNYSELADIRLLLHEACAVSRTIQLAAHHPLRLQEANLSLRLLLVAAGELVENLAEQQASAVPAPLPAGTSAVPPRLISPFASNDAAAPHSPAAGDY